MLTTAILAAVAVPLVAFVVLAVRNYRRRGDGPEAARQASRKVFAFGVGVALAVGAIASEALGALGVLLSASPDAVGQIALGALAVAGFAGWLEVGVVGATIAVVAVLLAVGVLKS